MNSDAANSTGAPPNAEMIPPETQESPVFSPGFQAPPPPPPPFTVATFGDRLSQLELSMGRVLALLETQVFATHNPPPAHREPIIQQVIPPAPTVNLEATIPMPAPLGIPATCQTSFPSPSILRTPIQPLSGAFSTPIMPRSFTLPTLVPPQNFAPPASMPPCSLPFLAPPPQHGFPFLAPPPTYAFPDPAPAIPDAPSQTQHLADIHQGAITAAAGGFPEDSDQVHRLKKMEEKMNAIQGIHSYGGIGYKDLCLFPDMIVPEKFKVPDFDKYDGTGNPIVHLKIYLGKMTKYKDNEKFIVQTFQESLKGSALIWFASLNPKDITSWEDLADAFVRQYEYNIDTAPSRKTLENMRMKPNQSFREYLKTWREKAAELTDKIPDRDIVGVFVDTLAGTTYFDYLLGRPDASFTDIMRIGEAVQCAIDAGKIEQKSSRARGEPLKKGTSSEKAPNANATVNAIQPDQQAQVQIRVAPQGCPAPKPYQQPIQAFYPVPYQAPYQASAGAFPQKDHHAFAPKRGIRPPRQFTPLPMPLSQALQFARATGHELGEPLPKNYRLPPLIQNPNGRCEYHLGAEGHDTDNCPRLKHEIQNLIDQGKLVFNSASAS